MNKIICDGNSQINDKNSLKDIMHMRNDGEIKNSLEIKKDFNRKIISIIDLLETLLKIM